jgi:hypothetical protein
LDYVEFNRFKSELKKDVPELKIRYKDMSLFMKILGKILFFNKLFMTKFVTTIGATVYYPSQKYILDDPVRAAMILSHEYMHARDARKSGTFKNVVGYLFPQLLALLTLTTIPLCFMYGSWGLFGLLFLLFLAPLPAYWRMKFEVRGYTMSLFAEYHYALSVGIGKMSVLPFLFQMADTIDAKNFKGPAYWFMWPYGVKKQLHDAIEQIDTGDILEVDDAFINVRDALTKICQSKNEIIL